MKNIYKIGDSFSKKTFGFVGESAKEGDRYYEVIHWLGLSFLPIKQFVTLELQNGRWNVISTS
jgi:hypothetical protein